MLGSNLSIFKDLQDFFQSACKNPGPYVLVEGGFSRAHILSFERVSLMILSLLKRSLSLELLSFFGQIGALEDLCTKSAFCQARLKLSSHFYKAWNTCLIRSFYQASNDSIKSWKGFRLCGVDGSSITLPEYEELSDYFGRKKHRHGSSTLAQLTCCYDLLNQLCIWAELRPYHQSEAAVAIEQLDQLAPDMLMIYDRHYPSFETFYTHHIAKQPFLMRIQSNFNMVQDFLASGLFSQEVSYKISYNQVNPLRKKGYQLDKHSTVPLRLIRVELSSGETEVLATSLIDEHKYPLACFAQLYNLRWKVETFFDRIKNKMALESFSGYKVNTIKQEVMAHIFLANVHSLIVEQAKPMVNEKKKNAYYKYQPNYNLSIGVIKNCLYKLFQPRSLNKTLQYLIRITAHFVEPIRVNRSFPRVKRAKARANKYRTYKNFKPAL